MGAFLRKDNKKGLHAWEIFHPVAVDGALYWCWRALWATLSPITTSPSPADAQTRIYCTSSSQSHTLDPLQRVKKKGNCIDKVKQHLQDYCLRTYACVYEGVKTSLSILHTEPRPIPLYALPALEKQYSARRSGLLYTNRSLFKHVCVCVCVP